MPSAEERFLFDSELDDDQRAVLSEYSVPRVALDGTLVWLADEVDGCA